MALSLSAQAGWVLSATLIVGAAQAQIRPSGPMPVTRDASVVLDQDAAAARQPLSNTGEAVYAAARPRLLQIRTLVGGSGSQSSIGSGFLVSRDGLAVTNYHVVSQYALEPTAYRLQSVAADGATSDVRLLAIDVIHDLAVVQLQPTQPGADPKSKAGKPSFGSWYEFSPRVLKGDLPKGERLFAMGNPLDLGFTIVEGTYNGLVTKSYEDRIHFSGAINAGMSGGPVVTSDGKVVGINVAKRLGGDLVSFLVPAKFAAVLVERARNAQEPAKAGSKDDVKAAHKDRAEHASESLTRDDGSVDVAQVRSEIARQLLTWQEGLFKALDERGIGSQKLGPYDVANAEAPWMSCWAQTNVGQNPAPKALWNRQSCSIESQIFIAGNLTTGELDYQHTHVRTQALNPFQFAHFLSGQFQPPYMPGTGGKRMTAQRCHEDVLAATDRRPQQRLLLCSRAYRDFDGLYDFSVTSVTQDKPREAMLSQLTLRGVAWTQGLAFVRRFVEATRWAQ